MKKTAFVDIQVDDKSLRQLNEEIKNLESSMQDLKVGTEDWIKANDKLGNLKKQFGDVTGEAKKLQGEIKNIGSPERIEAVVKLGQGMVGAFASAQASMQLLGVTGNETLEAITARGVQFLQIMTGLDAAAKVFKKSNLDALKAVGGGFRTLVLTVRGASLAMKTALISTGIGALVVGVGLLIANWEKFTNLLNRTDSKRTKTLEDNLKAAQDAVRLSEEEYNIAKEKIKQDALEDSYQREYYLRYKLITDELRVQNDLISNRIKEETALQEKLKNEIKNSKDEKKKELELELELSKKRQERLNVELGINATLYRNNDELFKANEILDAQNDAILQSENNLKRLNVQAYTQRSVYNESLKILDNQIAITERLYEVNRDLDNLNRLNTLRAERDALLIAETLRQKQLAEEKELLEIDIKRNREASERFEKYQQELINQREKTDVLDLELQVRQENVELLEDEYDMYLKLSQAKEQLVNFDKVGRDAFYEQNQAALERLGITKEQLSDLNTELELYTRIKDGEIERAEKQLLILNSRQEELLILQAIANAEKDANTELLQTLQSKRESLENDYNAATSHEERLSILSKIRDVEAEIQSTSANILSNNEELSTLGVEILAVDYQIDAVHKSIAKSTDDIADKQKEVNETLKEQERLHKKLNDWLKKYSEEIAASQELINNSFQLLAVGQEARAAKAQLRIDKLKEQLDALNEQEKARQDRLLAYEKELEDAGGERYNELLGLMDAERNAANAIADDKLRAEQELQKQEKIRMDAEYKAAKWRKAQSITDALIQTTLATIKALPNLVLSGIVAAAGAVGVAAIAKQPLPPKAEGGGRINGRRHSQGGTLIEAEDSEFIVNRQSTSKYLPLLHRINNDKYENGGAVNAPDVSTGGDLINYEKLGAVILDGIKQLPSPNVSVLEIMSKANDVTVTKHRAGI